LLNTDRETSSFASAVTPLAILSTKLFVCFPPRAMIFSHFFFIDGWFGFNNKRFITTISFSIICRFGLHVFVGFLQMDSSKRYSYNGRWSRCFWWIKIEFYDGFFIRRGHAPTSCICPSFVLLSFEIAIWNLLLLFFWSLLLIWLLTSSRCFLFKIFWFGFNASKWMFNR
jgi:hypothetical protein